MLFEVTHAQCKNKGNKERMRLIMRLVVLSVTPHGKNWLMFPEFVT